MSLGSAETRQSSPASLLSLASFYPAIAPHSARLPRLAGAPRSPSGRGHTSVSNQRSEEGRARLEAHEGRPGTRVGSREVFLWSLANLHECTCAQKRQFALKLRGRCSQLVRLRLATARRDRIMSAGRAGRERGPVRVLLVILLANCGKEILLGQRELLDRTSGSLKRAENSLAELAEACWSREQPRDHHQQSPETHKPNESRPPTPPGHGLKLPAVATMQITATRSR